MKMCLYIRMMLWTAEYPVRAVLFKPNMQNRHLNDSKFCNILMLWFVAEVLF